ncbi:MAG: hypothetical protein ACRDH7_13220 [Actinomycetota bacterium]
MDPDRVRSLGLVKEVVRDERAAQLSHFDALDTKAGIILGFAGALIALSPSGRSVIIGIGKVSALASAIFAIATFWPRRFWNVDVRSLRDDYLAVEPHLAEVRVLDTMIAIAKQNDETLARRGRQLKVSMSALGMAAFLVGLGTWLH